MKQTGWIAVRLFGLLCAAGCQQEMASQPSLRPLEPSTFFADGRGSRALVDGTVARGRMRAEPGFETGRVAFGPESGTRPERKRKVAGTADGETARAKRSQPSDGDAEAGGLQNQTGRGDARGNAAFVEAFPLPVDRGLIEHGRNRYRIYCEVCHDSVGTGFGKIVERGYTAPPSFHTEKLRDAPVGMLFSVAHDGYGSMPSYGEKIPDRDLWAIVAYVRALQLSQRFPRSEVTEAMRREWAAESARSGKASQAPVRNLDGRSERREESR